MVAKSVLGKQQHLIWGDDSIGLFSSTIFIIKTHILELIKETLENKSHWQRNGIELFKSHYNYLPYVSSIPSF